MIESGLIAAVFLLMLTGIMECARLAFTYNSISFAAHRAARFAALRGSTSGHPAAAADVQAEAQALIVGLDPAHLTITPAWTPDNHPGSSVQVRITYGFSTLLVPLSSGLITVSTTSGMTITQ